MVSILVDENLLLRTYEAEDTDALFNAINSSRAHLRTWFEWVDKTTKPEHTLRYIEQSQDDLENQNGMVMGIFYKGDIIGSLGMHHWDKYVKRAQVGYWLKKEHEGRGIMAASAARFIAFLFENVGLNKLEIHYRPANKKSAKMAERLGFKTEGLIRQSVIRNGMAEDVIVTGLLKTEWMVRANS